jgi:hypothetical protein
MTRFKLVPYGDRYAVYDTKRRDYGCMPLGIGLTVRCPIGEGLASATPLLLPCKYTWSQGERVVELLNQLTEEFDAGCE